MMCKPKDDLRKDCRLMEFNCLINKVSDRIIKLAAVEPYCILQCPYITPVINKVCGSTLCAMLVVPP